MLVNNKEVDEVHLAIEEELTIVNLNTQIAEDAITADQDGMTIIDEVVLIDSAGGPDHLLELDTPILTNAKATATTPQVILQPDENCDSPDFLRSTTFIVNTAFYVLICIECNYAVGPASASSHLRKNHKQCASPPSLQDQLERHFPSLKYEPIHPGKKITPVFGLTVHNNYLVCTGCLHGYLNSDTLRKHCCRSKEDNQIIPSHFTSPVQTFFAGLHRCYFPVITSDVVAGDLPTHYNIFKQSCQHRTALPATPSPSIPDDHRQLLLFLRKEGWMSHTLSSPPAELARLVQAPETEGPFQHLQGGVFQMMERLQNSMSGSGHLILRLIGKRPSTARNGTAYISHGSVEIPTLKRYSAMVSRLVAFLLRCHIGWESTYFMPLTAIQAEECSKLLNHLEQITGTVTTSNEDDLSEGPPGEDEDELDEVVSEQELPATNESLPVALSSLQDFSQLDIRLLNLLSSLFTHLPMGTNDKFYSPLVRFLVLEAYQPSGNWLPPRRITEIIAVLAFIGRQILFYQILKAIDAVQEARYSVASYAVQKYLDEEWEGPLSTLYLLKRPLDRLAMLEDGSTIFTALDFTGQNVIINGKVLYVSDIKSFVESTIKELRHILAQDLLFGLTDIVDIESWSPGVVHEEPRNLKANYSCFKDPHNSFNDYSDLLLRAVLDRPEISGRFHMMLNAKQLVWKAGPCLAYLEKCHAFEMLLFAGSHTTVGEPPRGTEVAAHTLRNIPGGNIRNVFILFQYFCFMGTFNKSVAHQGSKIMRVPHPDIGRLWSLYIAFVRPLVTIWQGYFHGQGASIRAENNLFFGLHRPVISSQLSRALAHHTERLIGVSISLALWRHISTWFLNNHAVKFQEYLAMANRTALASQMGHSDLVHGLYAGDARLPSGVDFHIFFQTIKTSGLWHELLGFPPILYNAITAASRQSLPSITLSQSHLISPPAPFSTELVEQVKASLVPEILRLIDKTRASDLATVISAFSLKPQKSQISHDTPGTSLSPIRLSELRVFLDDPNARFKTQQQAEFTEALVLGEPSIMVIGPTGSGKTLPIMLTISQHDHGKTTAFLLPLLAMHDEYHERARKYGLSSESWNHKSSINGLPQILLVAVEHCTWESLKVYLNTAYQLGSLARIVVDESHLLLKHASFRPCMDLLQFMGGLPISIVLMTATCPPTLEREMFSKLGRTTYRVLRQSTHRPEICQRLMLLNDVKDNGALQTSVAHKIRDIVQGLQQEERVLLFCYSHHECDTMAEYLGWKPYHAHIAQEERAQSMHMWKSGKIQGLACTSMLNCCLDYSYVRFVFHLGLPRDAIDYMQAIGRCSRDGNRGTAIVYYRPRSHFSLPENEDRFGRLIIKQMTAPSSPCYNLLLECFLDGQGRACFSRPGSALCDSCERGALTYQHKPATSITSSTSSVMPRLDTLFAAAYSRMQVSGQISEKENFGSLVRLACDVLYKFCVYCWLHTKHCMSHTFKNCPHAERFRSDYMEWSDNLVFPAASCFYCGGPQRLQFLDGTGRSVHVHDHPSDETCHWADVFRPLAFFIIRMENQKLREFQLTIPELQLSKDDWTKWLCTQDDKLAVMNMVKLLQQVCAVLPLPFIEDE